MPPKFVGNNWAPPVDTPAGGYGGPFPMERVLADWGARGTRGSRGPRPAADSTACCAHSTSCMLCARPRSAPPRQRQRNAPPQPPTGGWEKDRFSTCPANYPKDAPLTQCGHYAFVELDATMAYKNAVAYAATGDERFAVRAMEAVQAWARTNKVFGLAERNGPLEAAWCARAPAPLAAPSRAPRRARAAPPSPRRRCAQTAHRRARKTNARENLDTQPQGHRRHGARAGRAQDDMARLPARPPRHLPELGLQDPAAADGLLRGPTEPGADAGAQFSSNGA